ncbi:MAG: thiolase family protein [Candidatus Bipolaricaulota bacterium]|nr:thiolase family protein [Candidatus Bipolaricaulota bacterium]MCS7274832.1 thiolase family protein [Candidatus Bipolaricaulota bacterium]MDW8111253.1 thiolase family protein [Candidatus Bipolaricaulota bacterium]MDW8328611.1 thiolase family protein [Candidatus Bipolaricaulota bacterium]
MREVVIVGAARCAVGRAVKGVLKNTRPDEMAAAVLSALIERTGVDPKEIEDIRLGCAIPEAEQGMNVARIAQFLAKIPETATAATINRFCASGLESVVNGCYQIAYGDADLIIAGGVESMSMVPMVGHTPRPNPKLTEEYPEVYTPMGITAENLAEQYKISREAQDRFAYESHMKAARATKAGRFKDEIVPLTVQIDGKTITHEIDETIREDTTLEALAQLKPAFKEGGTVTPGNSSPLTDGASAVLIASKQKARSLGLKPMARFVAAATAGVRPEIMGIGPVYAIPKALQKAKLSLKDIDLFEFNEAFAAQALAVIQQLDLPMEKINVNGGAIALGHALGSSGCRLLVTLVHEMPRRDAQFGVVTMCVGGGQGMAAVFERI